jgi:hypothetical protein
MADLLIADSEALGCAYVIFRRSRGSWTGHTTLDITFGSDEGRRMSRVR